MKLVSKYKQKKREIEFKYNTQLYKVKVWVIKHFVGHEDLEEYCIDHEILHDYYNEPPEYDDYRWDRD